MPDFDYICPNDEQQCDAACKASHPTKKMRSFASVEDMDETMVSRWNSVVKPQDHVYHLGDVAFGDLDRSLEYCMRLRGHKRLVLGNHDDPDMRRYMDVGFKKIYSSREFDGVVLTHIPLYEKALKQKVTWNDPGEHRDERFKVNVHGHIHNNMRLPLPWYNVSVEVVDYTPVHLDVIRKAAGLKHGG